MMEACCSRFTAAEGGARLAAAAATKNILAVEYASFIPVRLLYEKAYQIRGSLRSGLKRSVYITRGSRVRVVSFELKILTDLGTVAAHAYEQVCDWAAELENNEVLICTSSVLKRILDEQLLTMNNINVLIVDSCHLIYSDEDLKFIMNSYKQCAHAEQPTILALTYPLFTTNKKDNEQKDKQTNAGENETKDVGTTEVSETKDVADTSGNNGIEDLVPTEANKIENADEKGTKDVVARETKGKKDLQENKTKDLVPIRAKETKNAGESDTKDISASEKEMEGRQMDALPRMKQMHYEEMGVYENMDDFDMYEKLEWKIEELERELCCQMDLAEDIDGGKRISSSSTKPRELIIEHSARPPVEQLSQYYKELENFMRDTVEDALRFIEDHRHDPTEIYGEELYDEFMSIPDPTIDPKQIFKQFLYVLEQLGPYAADKAAFSLLIKLEKLKIKIPYERHFILMCLCTTVFLKIRCYADLLFSKFEDEWERIKTFSSPKILRFAEILEKFNPPDIKSSPTNRPDSEVDIRDKDDDSPEIKSDRTDMKKMLSDLDKCDFNTLGNKLQDRVNTYESNLKDLDSPSDDKVTSDISEPDTPVSQTDSSIVGTDIEAKSDIITNIPSNTVGNTDNDKAENVSNKPDIQADGRVSGTDIRTDIQQRGLLGFTRRSGYRLRGRTRLQRNNAARILQMQQNPDALCGIVYMKEPLIAKIMFLLIVDMSRSNSRLNYICVQYCATENPADPGTEPRECQRQGKRQEEVLKKFRMHECNLLLATSALEEGIDLPRCNLVLRWDVPASYRSYGLCRGRARATRATAALLCSNNEETTEMLLHNVATYRELDQIISRKCGCGIQDEPPQTEEDHADAFTNFVKPYSPNDNVTNTNTDKIRDVSQFVKPVSDNVKVFDKNRNDDNEFVRPVSDNVNNCDIDDKSRNRDICKSNNTSIIDSKNDGNTPNNSNNIEISNKQSESSKVNDDVIKSNIVNNAMEIVNETINTVNDAIKSVSEAINSDGIEDLINQIEDLTANISVNDHKAKKNNNKMVNIETGEIEVSGKSEISGNIEIVGANKFNEAKIDTQNATNDNNIEVVNEIKTTQNFEDKNNENLDKLDSNNYNFVSTKQDDEKLNKHTEKTKIIESIEDNKNSNSCIEDINKKEGCSVEMEIREIQFENHNSAGTNILEDSIKDDDEEKLSLNNTSIQAKNSNKSQEKTANNQTINTEDNITNKKTNNQDFLQKSSQEFPKEIQPSNILEGSSESVILTNGYCDRCLNIRVNSVCLCCNVHLYYQLLAKVNRSEFKKGGENENASVDLTTAIALINRYCGKLPSDTFTRLAPQWWMEEVHLPVEGTNETKTAYICTLRLPLNCPVKYNIVGHPMPTKVLARRMVALQACRILHKSGELDNQLMPIGKENFKAVEVEGVYGGGEPTDVHDSARPGTTKRRQYYYKRTAWAFTDCQPVIDTTDEEIYPGADPAMFDIDSDVEAKKDGGKQKEAKKEARFKQGKKRNMLYAIVSTLWCALPERYNTRGRRLHAPQLAAQAIGVLMARQEPDNLQIPAFPVYTRSGEVRVSVEHVPDADVRISPRRAKLVRRFMRFVFAEVLRVRRRGMKLQSEGSTHNNYYIVPTIKTTSPDGTYKIDVDWAFLELIYIHTEEKRITDIEKPILWQEVPEEEQKEKDCNRRKRGRKRMANPLLKKGETFVFDAEKYREAVVTPWYRNQDQPQFFLVAEICWNLSPDSSFPSATHQSFRDYYSTKYGVSLTQRDQPLLDVDHTSARLNLLTPRYVNRKGVALPVSSERTRRAKRDRLDQKQILIPELCRVHPFAAPLWFATVALPCVLYRINALLIADEIRRAVAIDVGLGIPKINDTTMPGFQWTALDFGWSLAEVLSADSDKTDKKKDDEESKKELKEMEIKDKEDKPKKSEEEQKNSEDEKSGEEVKEKTINDILQEKEDAEAEAAFEIGTWSNDMASSIPDTSEYDELMEPLPPNLTFCTSASSGANWRDPITRPKINQFNPNKNFSMADSDDSFMSSDLDSDDTDLDFDGSEDDTDISFCGSKNTNTSMGVRIEYKTAHEAEAFDIERTKKVNPAPMPDEDDDAKDRAAHDALIRQGSAPQEYIEKFRASVTRHKQEIKDKNHLITKDNPIFEVLPELKETYHTTVISKITYQDAIKELFPYGTQELEIKNGQIDVESIERNKRVLLDVLKKNLPKVEIKKMNCFSMNDINIDSKDYVNEKIVNVGFDSKEKYEKACRGKGDFKPYFTEGGTKEFDFDYQPTLEGHPGPSPSVILQALTMSNANDGINLERLETIGDSFLKFAITAYLYCAHPTVHEGKLSHMRSKQVSNLNLYRLGRNKRLGARMIASKFEPHDNWLPPCHKPPPTLHPRINGEGRDIMQHLETPTDSAGCFIPYNLITQHSIPDKSIADCVEALIGAYLLECGPRGALLFMSWLGIRVLPCHHVALDDDHPYVVRARRMEQEDKKPPSPTPSSPDQQRKRSSSSSSLSEDEATPRQELFPEEDWSWRARAVGSLQPYKDAQGKWMQPIFGELKAPPSPLLRYIDDPEGELEQMLSGYDALERTLQYRFKDRSLLLQALTHASHHSNRLTDCYQRLEFLGDAILDYLITRHLYEDPRRHSPGALTDLRSALVNNTIFATLAARHGFHKYFRHMSPGLNEVLTKYVKIQEENGHSISEEHYLIQEDEMEQAEDVEVPKALGDLFESVAGAIFLDSGMSLGAVWKSYVNLMGAELEAFSAAAPKSPVRELLEAEPDTAKFGKPERLADGRRVRVCVEVFGRGTFKGVGRNYRIAKGTAARCALRHLKGTRVDH